MPGFSTVDANGQSRVFSTSVVGGTTASSGESVVITTRSDYELGAFPMSNETVTSEQW